MRSPWKEGIVGLEVGKLNYAKSLMLKMKLQVGFYKITEADKGLQRLLFDCYPCR